LYSPETGGSLQAIAAKPNDRFARDDPQFTLEGLAEQREVGVPKIETRDFRA
jgi:hypothetical protein